MTLLKLTKKEQQITLLPYGFRFINSNQIQRFLNHKDKRRINGWLKELVQNGYLIRIYDPDSFEKRSKLAVFYSGPNGIKFFQIQKNCFPKVIRKLYRDSQRSEAFINERQLLVDCCLNMRDHSTNGKTYVYETQSDYANPSSLYHFLTKLEPKIEPKIAYLKQVGGAKQYFLLNYFEPTIRPRSLRKKVRNYIDFYFSSDWEENINAPFPTILFICPDKPMLIRTKRTTKKLLEEHEPENLHIRFGTEEDVKNFGLTADIWEEAE